MKPLTKGSKLFTPINLGPRCKVFEYRITDIGSDADGEFYLAIPAAPTKTVRGPVKLRAGDFGKDGGACAYYTSRAGAQRAADRCNDAIRGYSKEESD